MISDAVISEGGLFRYQLARKWDLARPLLGFVMLNPSTADAERDDPTVRKCMGFAERLGFGGILITNLFAWRATDPADLRKNNYPIGPENNWHIATAARECGALVCAWGANARGLTRVDDVLGIIEVMGVVPMVLRTLPGNVPAHPLMLPYSCSLTVHGRLSPPVPGEAGSERSL